MQHEHARSDEGIKEQRSSRVVVDDEALVDVAVSQPALALG